MAKNTPRGSGDIRCVEILFTPWRSGHTTVNVFTVDYRGDRRMARRIGSCDLRMGPSHLVGLTPAECTWALTDAFHEWLSEERSSLPHRLATNPRRGAASAPPEGVTGAASNVMGDQPLPGL